MDYDDPATLDSGGEHLGEGLPMGGPGGASTGVVTIGRKKYAVNLYWQPSPSGRVSQAAREAANQPGQMADFYAARPGNSRGRVPQFGLGQKEYGHKVGQPTGAASLAEDQPGSWAGVFRVPEGFWLVVSRDDLIAPDGDILFATEQEARTRLFEEVNLGGLQRIYAPANWNVSGSDAVEVALLMQGRSDFRLQFVKYPVKAIAAGVAVLFVICILGYLALSWQQERQDSFEEGLNNLSPEQQAIARMQQAQQLAPPPPPPPPPKLWQDAPAPQQFLSACQQGLAQVPATVQGWRVGEVICSGTSLTVNWIRNSGEQALLPPNTSVMSLDSSTISTYELPAQTARGAQTLGANGDLVHKALRGNWPIALASLPDDPAPAPAPAPLAVPGMPAPKPAAPLPSPWIKKKITIRSDTAPWNIWSTYADLPGLVLNSVTWSGTSWVTEGVIYENR